MIELNREKVAAMIESEYQQLGVVPGMIIFTDKGNKMTIGSMVERSDWLRFLAMAMVFAETGRMANEKQVVEIIESVEAILAKGKQDDGLPH